MADVIDCAQIVADLTPEVVELTRLITSALSLADELDQSAVALHLNDALVSMTGEGLNPPGW